MTVMNPFWYSTQEQRAAGRSTQELEINEWINELEQSGYGNFTKAKFKTSQIGSDDLREVNIVHDGIEVNLRNSQTTLKESGKPLRSMVLERQNKIQNSKRGVFNQ